MSFTLPQSAKRNWSLGVFEGAEAFWMRFRIVQAAGAVSPVIRRIRIDTRKQFAKRLAAQGRSHADTPLGSSDGAAGQRFEGSKEHFVVGSDRVFADNVQWTRVENFLASRPTDRHYAAETGEKDRPVFVFGDGVNGLIPPLGVGNIRAEYRFGAELNGNVGALTISADRSGLTFVGRLFNPRAASGWLAAQGSDDASLEQAKIEGPASLRVRDVALGPNDVEAIAKRASTIDPALPSITRAKSIEEGFGPKTIELVTVAAGGGPLSTAQLSDLSEFFNGDQFESPPRIKRLVANQEVTAVNYTQRAVDVTATVRGNVLVGDVTARLAQILHPEVRKEDSVTFEWAFGGRVPVSRIAHEIFEISETITDVDIVVPAADIQLEPRELPILGAVSITVVQE